MKFTLPTDYRFTAANSGSDVTDSDVDDTNGAGTTATIFLSPTEDDRTWDAGAYRCSMISGDVVLTVVFVVFFGAEVVPVTFGEVFFNVRLNKKSSISF